jgi:hypothetical protein
MGRDAGTTETIREKHRRTDGICFGQRAPNIAGRDNSVILARLAG